MTNSNSFCPATHRTGISTTCYCNTLCYEIQEDCEKFLVDCKFPFRKGSQSTAGRLVRYALGRPIRFWSSKSALADQPPGGRLATYVGNLPILERAIALSKTGSRRKSGAVPCLPTKCVGGEHVHFFRPQTIRCLPAESGKICTLSQPCKN